MVVEVAVQLLLLGAIGKTAQLMADWLLPTAVRMHLASHKLP